MGAALNFWNQGANGIYLFNWYARKDRRHESLREIGDPSLLRRRDKVYEVHRQEGELWANTHPPAQIPSPASSLTSGDGCRLAAQGWRRRRSGYPKRQPQERAPENSARGPP